MLIVFESKPDVELSTDPFWFPVRLSCSLVLFDGLRPSPSLLLPSAFGCLMPLASGATPLTRGVAPSTAARDDGSGVRQTASASVATAAYALAEG